MAFPISINNKKKVSNTAIPNSNSAIPNVTVSYPLPVQRRRLIQVPAPAWLGHPVLGVASGIRGGTPPTYAFLPKASVFGCITINLVVYPSGSPGQPATQRTAVGPKAAVKGANVCHTASLWVGRFAGSLVDKLSPAFSEK